MLVSELWKRSVLRTLESAWNLWITPCLLSGCTELAFVRIVGIDCRLFSRLGNCIKCCDKVRFWYHSTVWVSWVLELWKRSNLRTSYSAWNLWIRLCPLSGYTELAMWGKCRNECWLFSRPGKCFNLCDKVRVCYRFRFEFLWVFELWKQGGLRTSKSAWISLK